MNGAPVRWGFLGAGMVASTALAPAVHAAEGAVLLAAAARDPARAAALGGDRAYDSYARLLEDEDVEAVYISLSNEAHLPWVLAALGAGKHVLCEKPLGLSAAEVDQMALAAGDLLLVEASWYRWHPRVRLTQQRLASIGAVRHVAAGFTFAGDLTDNYRLEPARGGGALYDVGCYAVSACLWAIGDGLPSEAVARATYGSSGVDLDSRAILSWASGVEAEVRACLNSDEGQWLIITGERGELDLRPAPYTAWRDDVTELWVSDGDGTDRLVLAAVDAYRLMIEAFSTRVRGGDAWVLPLAQSRECAAVLEACRTSAAAGGAPIAPG